MFTVETSGTGRASVLSLPMRAGKDYWKVNDFMEIAERNGERLLVLNTERIEPYFRNLDTANEWKVKINKAFANLVSNWRLHEVGISSERWAIKISEVRDMFTNPQHPKAFLFKLPTLARQLYKLPTKPFINPKWPEHLGISVSCWSNLHRSPMLLNIKDFAFRTLHTCLPLQSRRGSNALEVCFWCGAEFEKQGDETSQECHAHLLSDCNLLHLAKTWSEKLTGQPQQWCTLFFSNKDFDKKSDPTVIQWWPIVIFWAILWAAWKFRNGILVPDAEKLSSMQAVHNVMCYLEGFRRVLEAGTGEQQVVWIEFELQKQWEVDNVELPGATMEEKIQYLVDTETGEYRMIKRLDFVNALYNFFRSFELNYTRFLEKREQHEEVDQ